MTTQEKRKALERVPCVAKKNKKIPLIPLEPYTDLCS